MEDNKDLKENEIDQEMIDNEAGLVNENKKKKLMMIFIVIGVTVFIILLLIIIIFSSKEKSKEKGNENDKKGDLYIEPSSGVHTHTLIFLPGLTNQPEDFERVLRERIPFVKRNTTKIVILRSKLREVSVFNGNLNYSWFDIYSFPLNSTDCYNYKDLKDSSNLLKNKIKEEVELLNGNYSKIIIGGHSQGAVLSLYTGFKNLEQLVGGIISFSGFLPEQDDVLPNKNNLNVFYAYGDADEIISPAYFNETIEEIVNEYKGIQIYVYENHTHYVKRKEMTDAGHFLDQIM